MRPLLKALALAALWSASSGPAWADASSDFVKSVAANCWSCVFYENVVNASNTLFGQMFGYFVGSASFMSLVFACLGLVFVWRITRIFGFGIVSTQQIGRDFDQLFRFVGRVGVVFTIFLTTASASAIMQPSNSTTINPVRDFFLDGPLALGTGIGCYLANSTMQTSSMGSANAYGPGQTAGVACSLTMDNTNWMAAHITAAKAILAGFHNLGVGGMAVGVQTATSGLSLSGNMANNIILVVAGCVLIATFLMFTLTFGLRYIDAALRATVALAFAPVFLIFWIFDRTRPMAHMAFKSVLFMAVLFAASGLVLGMATAVMTFGIETALGTTSIDPAMLATKSIVHLTPGNSSSSLNLYALMMMLGCWGVSVGLAGAAFKIAEELVSFDGAHYQGETGAGTKAAGQMSSGLSGMASGAQGVFSMGLGLFGK